MRGATPLLAIPSYFRQISKRGRVPALYGFQVQGLLNPRNLTTHLMIKKIQITLLVEVDTENTELCSSGDPLLTNCVLNTIEDDFFLEPVEVLEVKEVK